MTTRQKLDEAHEELLSLLADVPNFEALLADNEAEEAKLRKARAKPTELAAARHRVREAQALLEQHHADIETSRKRVAKLEQAVAQEAKNQRIAALKAELAKLPGITRELEAEFERHLLETTQKLEAAWEQAEAVAAELRTLGVDGGRFLMAVDPGSVFALDTGHIPNHVGWLLRDTFSTRRHERQMREHRRQPLKFISDPIPVR